MAVCDGSPRFLADAEDVSDRIAATTISTTWHRASQSHPAYPAAARKEEALLNFA
jgi:hypothetical protein